MGRALKNFLDHEVTEFHICPLSVAEICYKWQRGRLPGVPDPSKWVSHALENFIIQNPDPATSLRAGLWGWDHGDLVDRSLAAIAAETGLTLIHTDKVLRQFKGFPQKWFRNVSMA